LVSFYEFIGPNNLKPNPPTSFPKEPWGLGLVIMGDVMACVYRVELVRRGLKQNPSTLAPEGVGFDDLCIHRRIAGWDTVKDLGKDVGEDFGSPYPLPIAC
jgi:hypothetical protein